MTCLIDYLYERYQTPDVRRAYIGDAVGTPADLDRFLEFCSAYLAKNRTAYVSPDNENYIVHFTDGTQVAVCPPKDPMAGVNADNGHFVMSSNQPLYAPSDALNNVVVVGGNLPPHP